MKEVYHSVSFLANWRWTYTFGFMRTFGCWISLGMRGTHGRSVYLEWTLVSICGIEQHTVRKPIKHAPSRLLINRFLFHHTEVNFIWAFHQVHHTPEDFNVFVGLRLPSLNRYMAIVRSFSTLCYISSFSFTVLLPAMCILLPAFCVCNALPAQLHVPILDPYWCKLQLTVLMHLWFINLWGVISNAGRAFAWVPWLLHQQPKSTQSSPRTK
jgi:hypothetical protein